MKKWMTYLIGMALMLTLLLCSASAAETVSSGACGSNLTWTMDSSGVVTIRGTGDLDLVYSPVNAWKQHADQVRRVIMEPGVKSISTLAFADCVNLESVSIPDTVTFIDSNAFDGCESLKRVEIPDSVTRINAAAFYGCSSLTEVKLPKNLTEIYSSVFSGCSSLKQIEFPSGLKTIGADAFYRCEALTSVTIPASVTSVEGEAFYGCSGLGSVSIKGTVQIGENAFGQCKNLKTADIQGISRIRDRAFSGCSRMKTASIASASAGTWIGNFAFEECSSLESIALPLGVQRIYDYAFQHCAGLKSAVIPASVEWMGKAVFLGCTRLSNVQLPACTGAYTFVDCPSLKQIVIPEGTTTIGPNAFQNSGLKSVYIPMSVVEIKSQAFECDLRDVYYGSTKGQWDSIFIRWGNEPLQQAVKHYKASPFMMQSGFTDVPSGAYYAPAVDWAVKHSPQITNGTSATTFSPDATCTRGQVVTFLWRAAGCPEPTGAKNSFQDVKSSDYYYKAVLWAVEKGITNGTSATTFSPASSCTRAHVVTFLWRAENQPKAGGSNPFRDVPSGQYYTQAVLWAVEKGITNGTSATMFSPNNVCTRGQIVTFLYRSAK